MSATATSLLQAGPPADQHTAENCYPFFFAPVSGMENMIDASEVSPDGRIEQAVGVGNHSDPNGSELVHGRRPVRSLSE
jgi:hypothetical protein